MCILCEQADSYKNAVYCEGERAYGAFYITNGNELNAIADDPYCGSGPLTINYCPICGRKLEHKETTD